MATFCDAIIVVSSKVESCIAILEKAGKSGWNSAQKATGIIDDGVAESRQQRICCALAADRNTIYIPSHL
jgi:hypothetical protein